VRTPLLFLWRWSIFPRGVVRPVSVDQNILAMFSSILPFAYVAGGAFLLTIGMSVAGGIIERSPSYTAEQQALLERIFIVGSGVMFLLIGFSIIPLFLRAFTAAQGAIGNGDIAFVRFFRNNECTITYVVWGIMAVTLAFLGPEMYRDMMGK
jgi:hypothetical protein